VKYILSVHFNDIISTKHAVWKRPLSVYVPGYVYTYSRSTNDNVNMSLPNSNFEGNFSTYVFGKSFYIIETWKMNIGHRDTYNKRKYEIISNVWSLDIM